MRTLFLALCLFLSCFGQQQNPTVTKYFITKTSPLGRQLWRVSILPNFNDESQPIFSMDIDSQQRVYVLTLSGKLSIYSKTGRLTWSYEIPKTGNFLIDYLTINDQTKQLVVSGTNTNSPKFSQMIIRMCDLRGKQQWQTRLKSNEGKGGIMQLAHPYISPKGDTYVVGDIDYPPFDKPGGNHYYVAKLDRSGKVVWTNHSAKIPDFPSNVLIDTYLPPKTLINSRNELVYRQPYRAYGRCLDFRYNCQTGKFLGTAPKLVEVPKKWFLATDVSGNHYQTTGTRIKLKDFARELQLYQHRK